MNEANQNTRITPVEQILKSLGTGIGTECLVMIYGRGIGHKHEVTKSLCKIGRDPDNDIAIEDDSVSRFHAHLERDPQGIMMLVDTGSTNGTYVNDQSIKRHILQHGDLIKIGNVIFKFLAGDNLERAYYEEIYRMAIQDGLTQIANRRYLHEFLEREFSRARRYKRELAVIMLDLDNFKLINDRLGHLVGDSVLRELASLIVPRIRREELLARYGGEEFAVILPETDLEGARKFAEILRKLVEEHAFRTESETLSITISLGLACIHERIASATELLQAADQNLYCAKRDGRNRVAG